ncbi:MAG: Hsp20/alpha crystallin family protein [Nitrososphaerota archaeon]|jgi:HSP20 family molecular chaperone IbpA|nr:Hsp20/alpha crystallin family protein [Nitrososphaerota archaeon]MDG6911533.1 Hsp20/alpha crystallin family protein [Nitrososphaerota archaeon]MDG6940435.1 Hsp20/alpha crystallin family protein [Nitrososphaerota archaeon]MDG6960748.1 Hsp20/alpha crystallin family protein [Nitrososphaerota archaeon]MDG6962366.1 Hsp20/alpha crystallin family protein [Nitrososphaerota archaeon]
MSHEIGRDLSTKSRQFFELVLPPADVFEDGSDLVIVVDLPGFRKEEIKTRLNESAFTVTAKREADEKDGISYAAQRPLRLSKRIPLPVKVETGDEEVTGKYEEGVLTVRIPIKGVGRVVIQ